MKRPQYVAAYMNFVRSPYNDDIGQQRLLHWHCLVQLLFLLFHQNLLVKAKHQQNQNHIIKTGIIQD